MTSPQPSVLTSDEREEMKTVNEDCNTGRAVRIVWTDSGLAHHAGWEKFRDVGERSRVMEVETVGIWMGENDDVVMVAHSRDDANQNWNVAMTIYKPCITQKVWLI